MDCIFCKIAKKEIPAKIAYEDNDVLAFYDIEPKAPVHILIIPKKHVASVLELKKEDRELIGEIVLIAREIAKKNGIAESGFRILANYGKDSGQTVDHLHFHLLGGQKLPFA